MKNQYVGDINDFAKYQLLRLCRPAFERIVVAWMLTAADGRTDGARIRYLAEPAWRCEDPELFDTLAELVGAGNRSVAAVELSGVLGKCLFERGPIEGDPDRRKRYFAGLGELACPDSLVFFDPDNGLEVPSVARHCRGSERYLYLEELGLVRDAGASVLVYQHFPRVDRRRYLDGLLPRLGDEMGAGHVVFAAYSSQVAFLFALRKERVDLVLASIERRCAESRLLSLFLPSASAA